MPNPLKASEQTCEDLRAALAAARAAIEPPSERSGFQGAQGAQVIQMGDTKAELPEGLEERIAEIRQALRDAGCEEK